MRYHILTAALVAGGFLALSGPVDAQYVYPYPPGGGYYQPYTPAPRYAPPRYYQSYAPAPQYAMPQYAPPQYPQPDPFSGYGGVGYGPQAGGGEAEFVRSLYLRHLGREPDPQGMDTWMRRLADFRGDTSRLTREFLPAARLELDANRYAPPAYQYTFPADRPRYR